MPVRHPGGIVQWRLKVDGTQEREIQEMWVHTRWMLKVWLGAPGRNVSRRPSPTPSSIKKMSIYEESSSLCFA